MATAALPLLASILLLGQEPPAPTIASPLGPFEYPERALYRGVSAGEVSVDCEIQPSGMLTDCRAVSEDPPGFGFAQAALSGARRSRISPETAAGVAPGTRVQFMIRFRLPDIEPVPATTDLPQP